MFAADARQLERARVFVAELAHSPQYAQRKIVTELVAPGPASWPAEDDHQGDRVRHGGSCAPKSD